MRRTTYALRIQFHWIYVNLCMLRHVTQWKCHRDVSNERTIGANTANSPNKHHMQKCKCLSLTEKKNHFSPIIHSFINSIHWDAMCSLYCSHVHIHSKSMSPKFSNEFCSPRDSGIWFSSCYFFFFFFFLFVDKCVRTARLQGKSILYFLTITVRFCIIAASCNGNREIATMQHVTRIQQTHTSTNSFTQQHT